PQTAIARRVERIDPLRNDPFHFQGAGTVVESLAAPDLMVTEVQRRTRAQEQVEKTLLPIPKRQRVNGFAVEVEEIEQEKHESIAVAAVRCILDQAEGGGAIGANAAQLAVEIGLPRRQRFDRGRDRRV